MTEQKTTHEPIDKDALGVPYFRAEIIKGREYGTCPRCGENVLRTPGSFGKHWENAVEYEAAHA